MLITGGAGFIGSHLAEALQANGEVRILDNLRSGHRRNLEGIRHEWLQGSVVDRAAVDRAMEGVDTVFHLAALVSVEESIRDPRLCVEINVTGLLHVLESAAAAGVRRVVFCSSAAVYGNEPTIPKREGMPPDPLSPYALAKWDGERYCEMFAATRGLSTVALRFFNVFGPRQDPRGDYASAVPRFAAAALRGTPLTIFGDGHQTRDFVFVRDVVSALIFAAGRAELSGVYNVGYGRSWSVRELAERVIALSGSSGGIEHAPAREGEVRHSRASVDKLLAAGWPMKDRREEGLAETVAWFRANPS